MLFEVNNPLVERSVPGVWRAVEVRRRARHCELVRTSRPARIDCEHIYCLNRFL